MGQMLTAKQVAEVKGCSYQYVKRIIKEGKLQAQEILNDKNRKTYLVPLEALDEELQQKWYQMNLENPPEEISTPEPVTDKKAVDHFSESERQEIDFWISLVEQWQQYRMKPGVTCKADVDKKFVALCGLEYPDKEISVDILYRKWKAVKENDLDGLIDKRGTFLKENGEEMSQMAICTYAKKYLATVEMITVAQSNFSMLMDEMNRYPDLDTSEALIRLASHHVMNALTNVDEEQMKEVPIEKLIKETNGLIRAAAYKKRIEVQNRDNYEAGLEAVKSLVFEAMAKENPELYRQVSAYLNKKKNEGLEG